MTAPPVTFWLLQSIPPTTGELSWKPAFDTGVIGTVCIAAFWLIRYLLDQLRTSVADHERRMDTLVLQHREDLHELVNRLDVTIHQALEARIKDHKMMRDLMANCMKKT